MCAPELDEEEPREKIHLKEQGEWYVALYPLNLQQRFPRSYLDFRTVASGWAGCLDSTAAIVVLSAPRGFLTYFSGLKGEISAMCWGK